MSQEKIDEIKKILGEAHRFISSLESIAAEFQTAMVHAETQEDRENLLKSVNLLEIEADTHKAIANAVERISRICIDLHENNFNDHQKYNELHSRLSPYLEPLVVMADAYEATSKTAKYGGAIVKSIKNLGIIAAAVALPEILRKLGYL